jgi:hypothetical protein
VFEQLFYSDIDVEKALERSEEIINQAPAFPHPE